MMMETFELWMVVGLGNPGNRYQHTRHNVGFMVVDALSTQEDHFQWRPASRFSAEIAKGPLRKQTVLLVKPQTYMNLSGQSVGPLARYYRIPTGRILVVHDDLDLDLGRIKVKQGGGNGGHKGIKSIIEHLSSADFIRIRLGIGRPPHDDVTTYVLQRFLKEEVDLVATEIKRAKQALSIVMSRGLQEAMNRYNRSHPKSKPTSQRDNSKNSATEKNNPIAKN